MLGVKTIGNATLVAYDKECILVTDPWMGGEDSAYFGSWDLPYVIPDDITNDIYSAQYIWFSHGHPDHLNPSSIKRFKGKKFLLPDHVGERIKAGLKDQGYAVETIPDRTWVKLSKKIKVFCITTVIQDAILLINVNEHLFVNLNDAGTRGCRRLIRKICKNYKYTYLLSLHGYCDADMINFFDEDGNFIEPIEAGNKSKVGENLSLIANSLEIKNVIPFSSFHNYQREDSVWANKYVTQLSEYRNGFSENLNLIPAFAIVDCSTGDISQTEVIKKLPTVISPDRFGDNWSDELTQQDRQLITTYFRRKEKITNFVSFINFRVGGKDNVIRLQGKYDKGITFEVPRNSLMKTINYEIFDDLLIGNFAKTTLHNMKSLYEGDFNFFVSKYGDNGRAESLEELEKYFNEYNKRVGVERFFDTFTQHGADLTKRLLPEVRESKLYRFGRSVYYRFC
jgi:hypothetical protein